MALLSPREAKWLAVCLRCWSTVRRCTLARRRHICICISLLKSVLSREVFGYNRTLHCAYCYCLLLQHRAELSVHAWLSAWINSNGLASESDHTLPGFIQGSIRAAQAGGSGKGDPGRPS